MSDENKSKPRTHTVRIWQDNEAGLRKIGKQRGLSFNRMVNVALAEWLANNGHTPTVYEGQEVNPMDDEDYEDPNTKVKNAFKNPLDDIQMF